MTSRGAVNALAVPSDPESIVEIVVELQRLQQESVNDPRIAGLMRRLMPLLQPTLRKVALRFGPTARGSLEHEDLIQQGFIEALKFIPKFDLAKQGSTSFEQHLYRRALSAVEEYVRLHAHDVHPSDGASRGRTKNPTETRVLVESQDAPFKEIHRLNSTNERMTFEGPSKFRARVWDRDSSLAPTPEAQLDEAETQALIRRLVFRLPRPMADLVVRVHGIGGYPESSMNDLARQWGEPRGKLNKMLKRAEQMLRKMVERELNARHRR